MAPRPHNDNVAPLKTAVCRRVQVGDQWACPVLTDPDRDRLREQVLRRLGWNLHRIWGTAWYRNRNQEEERLHAAIDAAIAAPVNGRLSTPSTLPERPVVTTMGVELDEMPPWVQPYRRADLPALPSWASPSDYDIRFHMVPGIEHLAQVEGPVHIDVALQRMREAWAIGRVGLQIRATIEAAITDAHVAWDGQFIGRRDGSPVTVRYSAEGVARKAEHIADTELKLAMVNRVREGGTVTEEELLTVTARLFGWARRGADINSRLSAMLSGLLASGQLVAMPDGLTAVGQLRQAPLEFNRTLYGVLVNQAGMRRPVSPARMVSGELSSMSAPGPPTVRYLTCGNWARPWLRAATGAAPTATITVHFWTPRLLK
jgi:hypothetical protein